MIQFYEGTQKKSVKKYILYLIIILLRSEVNRFFENQEKLFFVWINSHFVDDSTMMKKKQV